MVAWFLGAVHVSEWTLRNFCVSLFIGSLLAKAVNLPTMHASHGRLSVVPFSIFRPLVRSGILRRSCSFRWLIVLCHSSAVRSTRSLLIKAASSSLLAVCGGGAVAGSHI